MCDNIVSKSFHSFTCKYTRIIINIFSVFFKFETGLQVAAYELEIIEKGTLFTEEVDIDERSSVEVFRVPAHNDVKGADFYHDFKMVSALVASVHFHTTLSTAKNHRKLVFRHLSSER